MCKEERCLLIIDFYTWRKRSEHEGTFQMQFNDLGLKTLRVPGGHHLKNIFSTLAENLLTLEILRDLRGLKEIWEIRSLRM